MLKFLFLTLRLQSNTSDFSVWFHPNRRGCKMETCILTGEIGLALLLFCRTSEKKWLWQKKKSSISVCFSASLQQFDTSNSLEFQAEGLVEVPSLEINILRGKNFYNWSRLLYHLVLCLCSKGTNVFCNVWQFDFRTEDWKCDSCLLESVKLISHLHYSSQLLLYTVLIGKNKSGP